MRLWLNKKRPCEIIRQLARSYKWFYKWLARFKQFGWPGLADQSRQRHTPSPSYPASARQLVVRLRRRAQQRKVGLCGARVLHSEIKRHRLLPKAPSRTTINRWLKEADLLSPPGESAGGCLLPTLALAARPCGTRDGLDGALFGRRREGFCFSHARSRDSRAGANAIAETRRERVFTAMCWKPGR